MGEKKETLTVYVDEENRWFIKSSDCLKYFGEEIEHVYYLPIKDSDGIGPFALLGDKAVNAISKYFNIEKVQVGQIDVYTSRFGDYITGESYSKIFNRPLPDYYVDHDWDEINLISPYLDESNFINSYYSCNFILVKGQLVKVKIMHHDDFEKRSKTK